MRVNPDGDQLTGSVRDSGYNPLPARPNTDRTDFRNDVNAVEVVIHNVMEAAVRFGDDGRTYVRADHFDRIGTPYLEVAQFPIPDGI